MAFDGRVVIDGNEIDKIRNVEFGIRNKVDDITTQPAGSTRNNLIILEREHDGSTFLWEWMISAKKENRKNGQIEFWDQDKTIMTYEFTNAFVTDYKITLGETKYEQTAMQTRERVEISTEKLAIETPNGRVEHSDDWDKR